jgi:hypothetical protein
VTTGELTIGARVGSYTRMPTTRTFNVVVVAANRGAGGEITTGPDRMVPYSGSAVTVSTR